MSKIYKLWLHLEEIDTTADSYTDLELDEVFCANNLEEAMKAMQSIVDEWGNGHGR